jgi:hypothetical protein
MNPKTSQGPRQKVDTRDKCHGAIRELTKTVPFHIVLDRPVESWEVANEAREALMANNTLIPAIEIRYCLGVRIGPAVVIPPKISVCDHNIT